MRWFFFQAKHAVMLAGALLCLLLVMEGCRNKYKVGHQDGDKVVHQDGDKAGHQDGDEVGHQDGDKVGLQDGDKVVHRDGDKVGHQDGDKAGHQDGDKVGDNDGDEAGHQDGEETRVLAEAKIREAVANTGTTCQEDPAANNTEGFAGLPGLIQDFLRYRHCRDFPQILDAPMKCGGPAKSPEVFLLLAIKSSPKNYERRAVLRQTWGREASYKGARVLRVFLSGTSKNQKEDGRLRQLLKIESEKFRDILQWDFHDTFFNLTLKQFLFHRWLSDNCPGAQFIMNGDDDIFVNTFNMVTYLRDQGADRHLFVGQLIAHVGPIRNPASKYYVPVQVFRSNSFPPYLAGGGILMSRYTAHVIQNKSLEVPFIPIDDVFLGMCLAKAGLAPRSHVAMSTVGVAVPSKNIDPFDPCFYRQLLMVHRFVPFEMMIMWNLVNDPGLRCGQKLSVYTGESDKLPNKM